MCGSLASEELKQENAEAVDVGLLGDPAGISDLWGTVAGNAVGGGGGAHKVGQAEVGDTGIIGFGEEDVGGLDVTMGDGGALPVQVLNAARRAQGNARPCLPVQWCPAPSSVSCVQLNNNNNASKVTIHRSNKCSIMIRSSL